MQKYMSMKMRHKIYVNEYVTKNELASVLFPMHVSRIYKILYTCQIVELYLEIYLLTTSSSPTHAPSYINFYQSAPSSLDHC
jgi:glutamyl-tRNA reductase